jgi:transcriptional regulator with XRE-family HTH domain
MSTDLRKRVERERNRRSLSRREAAALGGVSNTTWGRYEDGDINLSAKVQRAIAQAFGWDADWPDQDYTEPSSEVTARLLETLADLAGRFAQIEQRVADLERRLDE